MRSLTISTSVMHMEIRHVCSIKDSVLGVCYTAQCSIEAQKGLCLRSSEAQYHETTSQVNITQESYRLEHEVLQRRKIGYVNAL